MPPRALIQVAAHALLVVLFAALAGCDGKPQDHDRPKGDGGEPYTLWECGCSADFESYYYYYEGYDVPVLEDGYCDTPRAIEIAVDIASQDCAEVVASYGFYNVECTCACVDSEQPCEPIE